MTERDPFGNEIPEEKKQEPISTFVTSSPSEGDSGFPGLVATPRPVNVRLWTRVFGLLMTVGLLGAVAAFVVVPAVDTVKDAADRFHIPSFTVPGMTTVDGATIDGTTVIQETETPPAAAKPPAEPPSGLQPGSMLRSDVLAAYLPKLRAQGLHAQTMRIDAQRISVNIIGRDGLLKVVSVSYDGRLNVVRTQARLGDAPTTSLAGVLSRAPARAVARAAAALGRPATQVNYIVLLNLGGTSSWFVYFKDGKYLRASLYGRHVERIG